MDAPDLRPEVRDPSADQIDPIGPPVLPKTPRYLGRSLALAGVALGTPLVALILETATGGGTPTVNY